MIIGIDAFQANKIKKTGVEWYCYHLIQNLKNIPLKPGDKFILYTPNRLRDKLGELPQNWEVKILNWPFKYFWNQIRLAQELNANPPDLFFSPGYFPPIFSKVKNIFTVHDLGVLALKKEYSFLKRFSNYLIQKIALKKANKIIVPSSFTKKELKKFFQIKDDKIKVILEGYQKKDFALISDLEKKNNFLNKSNLKKPYFLFIGRLEKRKNLSKLIKAYRLFRKDNNLEKIPDLILIGSPGQGYQKIKKEILKTKGIKEMGYLEKEKLPYFYNQALAFIFPSLYEGFGLPLLEAMACGCPVLSSKETCLPEIGGNAVLYFDPKNTLSIKEKMAKIVNNDLLINDLKEKGLARVKNFSWEKCAKETAQLLFKVLKN